eukprot:CAMPEP_0114596650 /NCGR_PEP_ID=MMETSP0125-20121206/18781_1 /TAXON_ID=485358 ORGANISM="Aristerostoma sp., Strain ATCC 50986" /NCGR_SAMPLE_ID=MMETSP0125 /ASSEMBLY_ACC=CAM_ASM_000245 /LENGTH=130 /DNA_ID=CAMNT_0001800115 /DNA_START=481 /DNA_END=874 /DNA_ORIENTATION=-
MLRLKAKRKIEDPQNQSYSKLNILLNEKITVQGHELEVKVYEGSDCYIINIYDQTDKKKFNEIELEIDFVDKEDLSTDFLTDLLKIDVVDHIVEFKDPEDVDETPNDNYNEALQQEEAATKHPLNSKDEF